MNLIGKKIMLRELKEEDMHLLNCLINNPKIEMNVLGWSKPVTMEEQNAWFKKLNSDNNIRYAISDLKGEDVFGTGIISRIDWKNQNCSLDIKISDEYQQKGYGNETISLLIEYAFNELNMHSISIKILDYNFASQKLFEKNGFKKVGVLRKKIYKMGKFNDVFIYDLLKEEYINERNR